jgi:hypothetical protein
MHYRNKGARMIVKTVCDDTDVIVFLVRYYLKLGVSGAATMEATSGDRKLVDIGKTVTKHSSFVPNGGGTCNIWL